MLIDFAVEFLSAVGIVAIALGGIAGLEWLIERTKG